MKHVLFRWLSLAFVLLLGLSSCRSTQGSEEPQRPPLVEPSEISRVVVSLSMGHLHGRQNFHFVPAGREFKHQDFYNTQRFTFIKEGERWVLSPESLQTFIAFQTNRYGLDNPGDDAPVYGARIYLYDKAGKLVNDSFASAGYRESYQFFASPSDVRGFEGEEVNYDASKMTDFLDYIYCDTNVWDKGAAKSPTGADGKKLYYFLPATEPVGFKGYYEFFRQGQFTLNLDLWQTPAGKLEGGRPSPFYAPNATVRQGKLLIHLELPTAIFADKEEFYDAMVGELEDDFKARVEAAPTDEARRAVEYRTFTLEETDSELRPFALRLMKLLKTDDWAGLQMDMLGYFLNGGDENSTEGYF